VIDRRHVLGALLGALVLTAGPAAAQAPEIADSELDLITLDFKDAELSFVIESIAQMTGKNFIYDDRVRGRVTVISPAPISHEQAYAVFESMLQVKGFTTVETPGGALKVIPIREAKESSVDTRSSYQAPANRDRFITRLIPLRYIDAESIVNTLKPLISKEAAMAAYAPTNTVILTESASNIRRMLSILESIDVDTYKEELTVIQIEHADAATLAQQISEIYKAEVSTAGAAPTTRTRRAARRTAQEAAAAGGAAATARIITDDRTNSLIVLATRETLEEVRDLVLRLDVPVTGGGRIHVHYLKHANAEELAQTLAGLISGAPAPAAAGAPGAGQAQAIRSTVTGLAGGISITADPATNALVIQGSKEGYATIRAVIDQLDVQRPQVLVEALIMEVVVSDSENLGFNALIRFINGDTEYSTALLSSSATQAAVGGALGGPFGALGVPLLGRFIQDTRDDDDGDGVPDGNGYVIDGILRAAANDAGTNIISAPHILTSDNEQAEIRIGDNIPIISSRVESAAGQTVGLSSSVNVERQDIGVTLQVTPQITEGDTLRLEILQEISQINRGLIQDTGDPEDVGVPLSNRRIENTLVVADGETVVIGGLISDDYQETVSKVPFLGDIPILGWAFKSTSETLVKKNLLIFITPHIVRQKEDLERATIRKREEFREKASHQLRLSKEEVQREEERRLELEAAGLPYEPRSSTNPVRQAVLEHTARYPLERMREIEELERTRREEEATSLEVEAPLYFVQAAVYGDEGAATQTLTELVDAGYDGTLVSIGTQAGIVLYEIRIGPYASIEEAQSAGEVMRRSHGLAPAVVVSGPEEQSP
jgi:general secretion pathway protein D